MLRHIPTFGRKPRGRLFGFPCSFCCLRKFAFYLLEPLIPSKYAQDDPSRKTEQNDLAFGRSPTFGYI